MPPLAPAAADQHHPSQLDRRRSRKLIVHQRPELTVSLIKSLETTCQENSWLLLLLIKTSKKFDINSP
jgi:hypothetical protein